MKDLLPLLLKDIEQAMQQVVQWQEVREVDWRQNSAQYMCRLEALVEFLEVADCGSVGGFGQGQGFKRGQIQCNDNHNPGDLFDRANWLLRKYKPKCPAKGRPACQNPS